MTESKQDYYGSNDTENIQVTTKLITSTNKMDSNRGEQRRMQDFHSISPLYDWADQNGINGIRYV